MTNFARTGRSARVLLLRAGTLGLLWLGACADDDRPKISLDATSPAIPLTDAGSGTTDAAAPGTNDAATPGRSDASTPSSIDASVPGANDAGTADTAAPAIDAGSASDAAAPDVAAPDAATVMARPLSTSLMLPNTKESPGAEPIFDVFRPMDLAGAVAASGRPLPVIVWANGGCFRSTPTWEPLFKRWAGAGFVVLALSVKPGGGILDALATTTQVEHGKQIDWVLAQAKQQGGPYAGNIDTEMIVAAGNSCGGVTAMELASKDPRVRAVFVLSGSSAVGSANTAVVKAIKVPVGFVVGNERDDIAAPNALMDYQMLTVPSMIVNRATGDHMTVSTDTMILPEVAEIALNWLDLSLYGNKQAAAALKAPNVCAKCTAGMWKLQSKMLETLEK
jgi:predicted dienelactone hydrolase